MNRLKKNPIFLLSILFYFHGNIYGNTGLKEMNDKASQLYRDGKYGESIEIWNDILKSGNSDANLFYNIGNAEAMLDHVPEAILSFEKALRIKPADHEILNSIKKERSKIENAVIPVNSFFLIEWYQTGLAVFRPGNWVLTGLLILMVALLQWLVSIKALKPMGQMNGRYFLIYLATGTVIILWGYLSYRQLHRSDEAIVMTSCECKIAPSDESPLSRTLYPGEKVKITDQIGAWDKLSLLNLDEGWLKKDCLKVIEIKQ